MTGIAAKAAAEDWTQRFFLVHAGEAGRGGAEGPSGVCVLEVVGFREAARHDLGPAAAGEGGAEGVRLRLAGLLDGTPALTHRLSLLEKAAGAGGLPPAQWLEGCDLAMLLFPERVDYSIAHLARDLAEAGEGEAAAPAVPSGPERARLYLRLLNHWRGLAGGMDPSLRSQVAALLQADGDPLAWFFSSRPGRPRLITLSERAPRRRGREDHLSHAAGRQVDPAELERFLGPEGPLRARDAGFEDRPEQRAMAREVLEAFNLDSFLVVEAGTGVGKSMAYLLPAALFSLANEERVVVSTHTKNLQDQLCGRDLPRLARAVPGLSYSRLKGRGNYLCLKRWEEWCGHRFQDPGGEGRLGLGGASPLRAWAALLVYLDRTRQGDLEELSLEAREQLREHLPAVSSHPEECLGPACPLRERCWVEAARDRAAAAHVVVVNHALLLSDAAEAEALEEGAPRPVLPAYSRLVVDEAHHLERVATEVFSAELSLGGGLSLVDRLEAGRGLLARFEALPHGLDESASTLLRALREDLAELRERLREFFADGLPGLGGGAGGRGEEGGRGSTLALREVRARVTRQVTATPAWEELEKSGDALAGCLEAASAKLADLAKLAAGLAGREGVPEDERKALEARAFRQAEACAARAGTVRGFFREEPEGELPSWLRWWEMTPNWRYRGGAVPNGRICMAPVEMGPMLAERLLAPLESAVFTSATLRAEEGEGGFAFFSSCAGLDLVDREERAVKCVALGSPFDYASQARCLVVSDLPEQPRATEDDGPYIEALGGVVADALVASRGRGLVLFTSYRVLERVAQRLFPALEEQGIACLKQERDSSNVQLLGRFREEVGSALFATSSFWEGVDVPGESLSLVIITKLPFAYFGDPLLEGRMEFIKAAGRGDGWREYYLPRAVMQFRQGLGRLIRRAADRGVMLVLDPRVTGRNYSSLFLGTLPAGLEVRRIGAAEAGRRVGEFLKG